MKNTTTPLLLLLLIFVTLSKTIAQTNPQIVFTSYLSGFNSPVDLANADDGTNRLFVVERSGMIKIIVNNAVLPTPFLNIADRVHQGGGERGLLGLAFHPEYQTNGFFYVNYTDNSGGDTRISRFQVSSADANIAVPGSEVILLEMDQPYSNHNAGDLNFSPEDGYLYIAMGDGGSGGDPQNRSQNLSCLLGKMLRINVDGGGLPASTSQSGGSCDFTSSTHYTIPADNPFATSNTVRREIWSIGWRNPWRFAFDPLNGNMWVADVGQGAWEEVDFELSGTSGLNYGWRCYEGAHAHNTSGCSPASSYVSPVFEYDHTSAGGFSITGGCVYRGTDFPNMVGHYVLADYVSDNVWSLFRNTNGTVSVHSHDIAGFTNISSFGVDEEGEMYAVSLDGIIYKVQDTSPLPVELSAFSGKNEGDVNRLLWTSLSEINTAHFDIERSQNGSDFYNIAQVAAAQNSQTIKNYSYEDRTFTKGDNFYRLKMVDLDGSYEYSKIISIISGDSSGFEIHPNPSNGKFILYWPEKTQSISSIRIYNILGDLIVEAYPDLVNQKFDLDLSDAPVGVYLIQVQINGVLYAQQIVRN
jgi:glucose/arabinose dehydrogenase